MLKKGFKTLDALDPSQGMLDIAQEKGIYRNYICDAIGKEPLKIPAGKNPNETGAFFSILFIQYRNANLTAWFDKLNQRLIMMFLNSF